MKKFTFLLTLLGLSASSAFAGVFTPSTDSESHLFAIKNPSNNYYCTVNGAGIGSTQNKGAVAFFKVIAGDEGQYYLYCQTNGKYVSFNNAEGGPGKVIFVDTKENAKQWKIKLEANQTERYDIFPNTVAGNNGDLSWNWHGGVGNNMGFYAASDGSSTWTFEEGIANLTFNYKVNDVAIATKTTAALPGNISCAPVSGVNYTHVESMSPANIVAGTTVYTVTLGESLPFTKSESYDNATWYVMDMHNNDYPLGGTKNYVWTFHNADQDITLPITDLKTATYSDNMLWCFVGDLVNGFKIYNKAAGSSLTLRKAENGNTPAVMSATNNRNQFKIYPSTQSDITGNAFCFKLDGDDHYVNTQAVNNVKVLRGYDQTDGGSSCRVFAPASIAMNYASTWVNAPEGAIGGKAYLETAGNLTALKNAYNAAGSNPTVENINALTTINTAIAASGASSYTFKEGYYRLVNRKDNHFLHIVEGNNIMNTQVDKDKAVGSVVYFKSTGEEGKYSLMLEGKYLGTVTRSNKIVLGDEASKGTYTVAFPTENFITKIQEVSTTNDVNYHYLHVNGGNAVGWEAGEGSPASHWYVIPATDIEVAMKDVEGKKFASVYLPFDVNAVTDAEAYVGTFNDDKSALNMNKVEGVPAGKGFVLVGSADKATLSIGTAAEVTSDLQGTNTVITLADNTRANYLVFGKNNNTVGFYAPSASVASIPANKAYLETSALSNAAIALNFNGTTTGVNTVVLGENGVNAPVFDLSGRRVAAPVKGGVYIQNGKKFIK